MIEWWQNIPLHLDPTIFTVGSFSLYWYAIFFLGGWVVAYMLACLRLTFGESPVGRESIAEIFLFGLLGALLGGRFGYAFFYDHSLLMEPLRLVSPFGERGEWSGISGMSYFGGFLGVVVVLLVLSRKRGWDFWRIGDFLVPLVPLALFFGRLGNFVNIELPGRVTEVMWGMRFPFDSDGILRHPSTLYEAALEGVALFIVLWALRRRRMMPGTLSVIFILLYGSFRFILERFREPDLGSYLLFGFMTTGQALALVSLGIGGMVFVSIQRRNRGILDTSR